MNGIEQILKNRGLTPAEVVRLADVADGHTGIEHTVVAGPDKITGRVLGLVLDQEDKIGDVTALTFVREASGTKHFALHVHTDTAGDGRLFRALGFSLFQPCPVFRGGCWYRILRSGQTMKSDDEAVLAEYASIKSALPTIIAAWHDMHRKWETIENALADTGLSFPKWEERWPNGK